VRRRLTATIFVICGTALTVSLFALPRPDLNVAQQTPPTTQTPQTIPTAPVEGLELRQPPYDLFERPGPGDVEALTADPAVRLLFDEMRACFPDAEANTSVIYEQALCYEPLVVGAARWMHPVDVLTAVNALVADRPDLFAACHNGGHRAAVEFTNRNWDPTASYEDQLRQFNAIIGSANDVCQNGFIHGFYDAVGYARPGLDSFRAAAAICEATSMPLIDCGHGLGHSAWYATGDFEQAARLCGVFTSDLRYRCDDGILMFLPEVWAEPGQQWAADPRHASWDPDAYYRRAGEVCDWWPSEREGDPEPQRGCWVGIAGGVLFRPLSELIIYADNDYFAVRDEMRSYGRKVEEVCASLGEKGEEVCLSEWGGHVLFLTANNADAIVDFCQGLVSHADRCQEQALTQLAEEQKANTESSRNQARRSE
jgi:hypothetical protein